ncbi:hypothetical protein Misp01_12240 [Microtetraspora sp. NBRC 13810]|nr:hypothetical protein Misp01_12240 [Microtetraspora sp. NBRC 13810]
MSNGTCVPSSRKTDPDRVAGSKLRTVACTKATLTAPAREASGCAVSVREAPAREAPAREAPAREASGREAPGCERRSVRRQGASVGP